MSYIEYSKYDNRNSFLIAGTCSSHFLVQQTMRALWFWGISRLSIGIQLKSSVTFLKSSSHHEHKQIFYKKRTFLYLAINILPLSSMGFVHLTISQQNHRKHLFVSMKCFYSFKQQLLQSEVKVFCQFTQTSDALCIVQCWVIFVAGSILSNNLAREQRLQHRFQRN